MNRRQFLIGGGAMVLAGVGGHYLWRREVGSMEGYNSSIAATRAVLSEHPEMQEFVRYATLAANGHNTQPWKFHIGRGFIEILPDLTRRTPIVDPDDHHMFVSLGCAAENLAIAMGARGSSCEVDFNQSNNGSVMCRLGNEPKAEIALFNAIPKRQSTRAEYDGRSVSTADLKTLAAAAAAIPGVDMILITDRPQMNRIQDLVLTGNSAQMNDPAFVRELKTWLRFSPQEAIEKGDGLFSAASGSLIAPSWLGPLAFDKFFSAEAENEKYALHLQSSSGIAIFLAHEDNHEHWVQVGRACQRFALQATALGLKHAFVNQPVEVAGLRPELAALAGMPGRRPDIVMRFGYGPTMPYSARRPSKVTLV
jgi:hypothetical protein